MAPSWIVAIENAAHTTARWFLNALKKTAAAITTVAPIADRIFPWAKLTLDGILTAEGGGAITTEANAVLDEIHRDLDVAAASLHDVGPTASVTAWLTSAANNIDGLIEAGHVKNPGNVSLIKNIVTSLLSLIGGAPAPADPPASN